MKKEVKEKAYKEESFMSKLEIILICVSTLSIFF